MGVVTRYGGKRIFGGYYTCLLVGVTQQRKKTLKQEALDTMGKRKPTNPLPKKHYKSEQDCQNNHFNALDIDQRIQQREACIHESY